MSRLRIILVLGLASAICVGCSTAPIVSGEPQEPVFTADRLGVADVQTPFIIDDPWEGLNRTMYRFNYHVDRWFLMPAVRTYRFIVPGFMRSGVHNFFNNLFGIRTLYNQILQARPVRAAQTTGRFVVNSTIGIAGLFDVATPMGMPYHVEDFGQTMGRWGVGTGPYLVLPVFGPSSLRDGFGLAVDGWAMAAIDPLDLDRNSQYQYVYYPLLILDSRDRVAFQYHQTGSPFEYELVRRLMLTKRQLEVEK